MHAVLPFVPFLPMVAFAVLALAGGRMAPRTIAITGVAPTALSALLTLITTGAFLGAPPDGRVLSVSFWTWVHIGGFAPKIAFYLDPLSLVMMLVVTFVGSLILLYSVEFMKGQEGYRRFFAYMNLFIGSMLILVLSSDLLFLLVGWEGVGLSSYLLIGFWYGDPANGAAARKAFIVTRVGDTALLVGLLLIFTQLGSLDIQNTMGSAQAEWARGSGMATAAALLILSGAIGKSAQLPLQTWLPDAMAGPTPVSALIHAATMVTAGVYLVARTHVVFDLAPAAQMVTAIIGAATLLYAGLSALAQTDIKRVLAYSTISQIGYMFLALGVGAWSAAIFHLMAHAFFKALLFLAAGLVIKAMGEEHDIRRMGGLRKDLPIVFWTFLIGAASLAAFPLVTAGFFSKDLVVDLTLSSQRGNLFLWVVAVVGALVTSLYAFRVVFLVFFGARHSTLPPTTSPRRFGKASVTPLLVLATLAVGGGWMQLPRQWGGPSAFTDFLQPVLPAPATRVGGFAESAAPQVIVAVISVAAIYLSYLLFARRPAVVARVAEHPLFQRLSNLALAGWGFDRLYGAVCVTPFLKLARGGRGDVIDAGVSTIAWLARLLQRLLRRSQSGRLRYYVAAASFGVIAFIAVGILR